MADINVERRGPRIWPWIIGLVILALLIWAIAEIVDWRGTSTSESGEVVPEASVLGAPLTGSHDVLAFWRR
jgi:hypothetical protein